MIMDEALNNECLPAIESLDKHIVKTERQAVKRGREHGAKKMNDCMKVFLRHYFRRWRDANTFAKVSIDTDLRQKIIRMMQNRLRQAFDMWRNGKQTKEIVMQEM